MLVWPSISPTQLIDVNQIKDTVFEEDTSIINDKNIINNSKVIKNKIINISEKDTNTTNKKLISTKKISRTINIDTNKDDIESSMKRPRKKQRKDNTLDDIFSKI